MNNLSYSFLRFAARVPVIKYIVILPIMFYLIKKLEVDLIGCFTRDEDIDFDSKVIERRRLLSYKILNLCRKIKRDGLIDSEQLSKLEDSIGQENNFTATHFKMGSVDGFTSYPTWGAHSSSTYECSKEDGEAGTEEPVFVCVAVNFHPSLIPWEADKNFVTKHPQYKDAIDSINAEMYTLKHLARLVKLCN